jgi:sigma-E factor negative regulatory protein RseC
MIIESGRIVKIEPEGLWVETIQRSSCDACRAQKGCGHSALAKLGASASRLWVLLEGRDANDYSLGEIVEVGVPEDLIVKGSLFIYLVPLVGMLAGTFFTHRAGASDLVSVLTALSGLFLGALIVRLRAYQTRFDTRLQPVLVDDQKSVRILSAVSLES